MHIRSMLKRGIGSLIAAFVLVTAVIAAPSAFAVTGQEMNAGGSAGSVVTIDSVSVKTTSDGMVDTIYYTDPGKTMRYNLHYEFSTGNMSSVGGQDLILYLPEGLYVDNDPTQQPFYINGRSMGYYTLENNTIKIRFSSPVNNLRGGDFNLQVKVNNELLARDPDQRVTIGGKSYPVAKIKDTKKHPVAKAGQTNNMKPTYKDLAENQIEWMMTFNPTKDTFTEPFTVNDELQTLGGIIDQDRGSSQINSWKVNPSELVVYTMSAEDSGIRIPLKSDRTGFSFTFTPDQVNGRTLYVRYRETIQDVQGYPRVTASEVSFAPNAVTVPATADMPGGYELRKTASTLSWGDANTDYFGTFQEHHLFYSSMEAFNSAKSSPDMGKVDGEKTKGASRSTIYSKAKSEAELQEIASAAEAPEGYAFKLVRMDSPDNSINVPNPTSDSRVTNAYYQNQTHKQVNYYYVLVPENETEPDPVPTTGTFVEHHLYFDSEDDIDDPDLATEKIDTDVQSGTAEEEYTTQERTTVGYRLVSVESTSDPEAEFDEEHGSLTHGNFVPGKELSVTYKYVKEAEKGTFVEKHYYFDKEKDATIDNVENAQEKDIVDATSGTEDDEYTTEAREKEGYHLVSVTSTSEPEAEYDANGAETRGTYVPNKELSVTYIYAKDAPKGAFIEHHLYFDNADDARADNAGAAAHRVDDEKTEGTEDEKYTTQKEPREGYHLVEVVSTSDPKAKFAANGDATEGNYVAGKTQEVTYIYVKDAPKGSFVEKHYYFDSEADATVENVENAQDKTIVPATEGTAEETYTTQMKPREGYHLVKVVSTSDPAAKFSATGEETSGNYVADKELSVTYIYAKDAPKGAFIEHHLYFDNADDARADNAGAAAHRVDDEKTEGTEDEKYTTQKEPREGYHLVEVVSTSDPKAKFAANGDATEGNYVAGKTQEVTYIYVKVQPTTVDTGTQTDDPETPGTTDGGTQTDDPNTSESGIQTEEPGTEDNGTQTEEPKETPKTPVDPKKSDKPVQTPQPSSEPLAVTGASIALVAAVIVLLVSATVALMVIRRRA